MNNYDFSAERQLAKLNPEYHVLAKNTAFVMVRILERYRNQFSNYTDHSVLHSMHVLDFCERLMADQVERLNADELYVLIMSCYLHDAGMGITREDYERLFPIVVTAEYLEKHPNASTADTIRSFHQEFSACFVRKFAPLLEIPSEEHIEAIAQVSRGHRKTDLFNRDEYPAELVMPSGNSVCLPYLACLIRLADEMDIARDRMMISDYENENRSRIHYDSHYAISTMDCTEKKISFNVNPCTEEVYDFIRNEAADLQAVLDYCREVVTARTKFEITQSEVEFVFHFRADSFGRHTER